MRYLALACDYDGTLAFNGRMATSTWEALNRFRSSGRRVILVTGRVLSEILSICTDTELFDLVVAENGGVLYEPSSRREKILASPPSPALIRLLTEHEIPFQIGRVVLATRQPHEDVVLRTIQELGLELHVIFNKGAVMVLPAGINKASGLQAALEELKLSAHNVVGVGDAENDHAFLSLCECGVVVANALPALKENADWVTQGENGAGVIELSEEILEADLHFLEAGLTRHYVTLGTRDPDHPIQISPFGHNLLITATSAKDTSSFTASVLEQLVNAGYQCCVIDSEGDYASFQNALALGSDDRAPSSDEILQILEDPKTQSVVNLRSLSGFKRRSFLTNLLSRIRELQQRLGRPHWLVMNQAHQVWPPKSTETVPQKGGLMLVSTHPDEISSSITAGVDTIVVLGKGQREILKKLRGLSYEATSDDPDAERNGGLFWSKKEAASPFRILPVRRRVLPGLSGSKVLKL